MEVRAADTGGLRSHFGEVDGRTLKFVPIRDSVDFQGFAIPELEWEVRLWMWFSRLSASTAAESKDSLRRRNDQVVAPVRDPDGNPLELSAGRCRESPPYVFRRATCHPMNPPVQYEV